MQFLKKKKNYFCSLFDSAVSITAFSIFKLFISSSTTFILTTCCAGDFLIKSDFFWNLGESSSLNNSGVVVEHEVEQDDSELPVEYDLLRIVCVLIAHLSATINEKLN